LDVRFERAREVIRRGIDRKTFPAAVAEVGEAAGVQWRESFGTLSFEPGAANTAEDTLFDLASLTKPIATATTAIELAAASALALDQPLSQLLPEWQGDDRDQAVVRDLLEHSSGLAARLLEQAPEGRREFEHEICTMRLEYPPRAKSIYSDLGFILLAFIVEDTGRDSLAGQFDRVADRMQLDSSMLGFKPSSEVRRRAAPTWPLDEDRRRGRLLVGEVHDNYAAALGGVAGHAGLFGTAEAVGRFARAMMARPELIALMTTRSAVPGSSRGLGWDTMLPTSSCGSFLSPAAFGHVGFTGTSLWIDPSLDRYFVLLTNRACRGGTIEEMQTVRRAFHDAAART
jgi:CubicO group peptidase (beta-lactamase class C family)